MFRIHRLFIKTAIAYLVLGVGLGGWLLLRKAMSGAGGSHDLTPVHTHLLLVGFMLMMVMGVSHWMFPRQPGVGKKAIARDPLAWGNYLLLNAGLILRVLSEPLLPLPPAGHPRPLRPAPGCGGSALRARHLETRAGSLHGSGPLNCGGGEGRCDRLGRWHSPNASGIGESREGFRTSEAEAHR